MKKQKTKKVKFRVEMGDRNIISSLNEDQNNSPWKRRPRSDLPLIPFMLSKAFSSTNAANRLHRFDSNKEAFFRTEFKTIIKELRPYLIPAPDDPTIFE